MEKHKPCLVSNLQTMNPDHFVRVSFALYMKRMGISKEKFTQLYDALAIENKYIDYYIGEETRKYQIDNIFDNPDYRYEPSCTTIKQKHPHLCLRGKCHRYIPNFKKRNMPKPEKSGILMGWRT
jgi:DNA primase large subunit